MESKPSDEERFSRNIIDVVRVIKELITICYSEGKTLIKPSLITLAQAALESYDKNALIENFISFSFKFWDQILNKEDRFFIDNSESIFAGLPVNHVNAFRELFEVKEDGKCIITDDEKNCVFLYFISFVKISLHYIHKKREPVIVIKNDKKIKLWKNKYKSEIRLVHYAKLFDVNLEW